MKTDLLTLAGSGLANYLRPENIGLTYAACENLIFSGKKTFQKYRGVSLRSLPFVFLAVSIAFFSFVMTGSKTGKIIQQDLIRETNKIREAKGLLPLAVNLNLEAAASAKADDMSDKHYFSHQSPQGVTPWDWMKGSKYNYSVAGENLAINYKDAEKLVSDWLASPTHKENLLNPRYRDIGVGIKEFETDGKKFVIVVEMFGTIKTVSMK